MNGKIRKISMLYDMLSERLRLPVIVGWFEKRQPLSFNSDFNEFSIEGDVPKDMAFIFTTNSKGVVLVVGNRLYSLISKVGGYGITFDKHGTFYVFVKTGRHGHIARFQLKKEKVCNYQVVVWGLSRGVHQIDIIGNSLHLVDTYNNRIIKLNNYANCVNKYWKNVSEEFFPNGKLKHGRKSVNYNHFNSIFSYGHNVYLVAHNETFKTNKRSELYTLNRDLKLVRVKTLLGSNCHNFYKNMDEHIFCASLEGEVLKNGHRLLAGAGFTRGLSVSYDGYLVGSSPVQLDKFKRNKGYSSIVFIERCSSNIVFKLKVSNVQIQEIRRLDRYDLSMSQQFQVPPETQQ